MSAAATVRFNPFSAEFRADPYPLYHRLREERPVHRTLGMWVLTRHADVRQVLRDRDFSAALIPQLVARHAHRLSTEDAERIERLGRTSLVFTDNPDHARLRALVNRVFDVSGLAPMVDRSARRLLRDGVRDVIADFAAPLPVAVLCEWMALPGEMREHVAAWTHDVRHLLEPGLVTDIARVAAVVGTFAGALDEVVAHRRARPGDDLISRLLAARTGSGDRLSGEEIAFLAMMCFVAGTETTTALIGNTVLALHRHPGQAALLRDRAELLDAAVEEAVRYDSPLQMTKRLATRDTKVGGELIQAGDQVLLCLGAANRDPAVFARPDEFDLTRAENPHVGFGHGMHGCLGGLLARLQTTTAIRCLLPEKLKPATDRLDWQDESFLVRGLERLPVRR